MKSSTIGAEWIWNKFYRNTRYFCQIFFCQKVRFLPLSREFPPRKREFSFGKTEIAKGILVWLKRIPFFEGEFPGKGVKTSLSEKKIFGRNTVYYGRICFRFIQHLNLSHSIDCKRYVNSLIKLHEDIINYYISQAIYVSVLIHKKYGSLLPFSSALILK